MCLISLLVKEVPGKKKQLWIYCELNVIFQEFRAMQDQLAETKERYRQASGGVTERTKILAEVNTLFLWIIIWFVAIRNK